MKKIAFIFPGQGSQKMGMLDPFLDNAIVRQTLEEASECLQLDIATLIQKGPQEDINFTINTQPIMLAANIAIYRLWRASGGVTPNIVAGHSLGEYAALVAARSLAFTDALALVRFRATVMQNAVPVNTGGMAAILGLSDEKVTAICHQVTQEMRASNKSDNQNNIVEAVNFNAPEQVVIAGHTKAVTRACEHAKREGAKHTTRLPVSAPFHSSLLLPASEQLRTYFSHPERAYLITAPEIPLINNVDAAIENRPEAIKNALIRQAAQPVRWVQSMQKMVALGITHLVECGPGKVLSGLAKRTFSAPYEGQGVHIEAMTDPTSLNHLLELTRQ